MRFPFVFYFFSLPFDQDRIEMLIRFFLLFLSLFPHPLYPLKVTVFFSLVAAWLLTHEIKGFMRPELQHVVREREKKEGERDEEERWRNLGVFFFFQTKETSTTLLLLCPRRRASPLAPAPSPSPAIRRKQKRTRALSVL